MGKAKKTRKFAEVKRMLNPKDDRIKALRGEQQKKKKVRDRRVGSRRRTRRTALCLICVCVRHVTCISCSGARSLQ